MKHLAPSRVRLLAAVFVALTLTGCGRDSVKVYKVDANDTTTAPDVPATMPATMPGDLPTPDNSSLPKLKYTLPDGWKEKALTQLRVASFEVPDNGKTADVSVIPLSGMAGGDLANVNRWRGQVGLSPLPETELQKLAEKIEVAGQAADLYDVTGTAPGSGDEERIIGVISHRDDTAWFFKLTGEAALVEKQKANFIAFLKSVNFDKLAEPSTMDVSQLPASHPAIPGMNSGTPTVDTASKPTWTVPADWKEGQIAQFLVAKFVIGSGDATAAVNVSSLNGDGGGVLPNINRWRGQIGLPPISESEQKETPNMFNIAVGETPSFDMDGIDAKTKKPVRLIGVIAPLNGQTWFYKLMGDPAVVAAQKDAFTQFVQSAKYPTAQ